VNLLRKKIVLAEPGLFGVLWGFLKGVLEEAVVFRWFFCGGIVVDCVEFVVA